MSHNIRAIRLVKDTPDRFNGILGQHYPDDDADHDLVIEESDGFVKIVYSLVICNSTAGSKTFRVYIGRNDAYGIGTALYYDSALAAKTTVHITTDSGWGIDNKKRLGIQASAGSSLTFTAFGIRNYAPY